MKKQYNIIYKTMQPITIKNWQNDKISQILNKDINQYFTKIGLTINNSNIKINNSSIENKNISIFNKLNSKTTIYDTKFKSNNINDFSFFGANIFIENDYVETLDINLGQYTFNNSFPYINETFHEGVYSLYLNNGNKTFWQPLANGILVKNNVNFKNELYIPSRLNGLNLNIISNFNNSLRYKKGGILNIISSVSGITNINFCDRVNIQSTNVTNCQNIYEYIDNSKKIEVLSCGFISYGKFINNVMSGIQVQMSKLELGQYISLKNDKSFNSFLGYKLTNLYNYITFGSFDNIQNDLNKIDNNKNLLYNHYHNKIQLVEEHQYNSNTGYNSNFPVGGIIWWPESWISRNPNPDKSRVLNWHKKLEHKDYELCDGHIIDNANSKIYSKLFKKTVVPDFAVRYNNSYGNYVDHFCNEEQCTLLFPSCIRVYPGILRTDRWEYLEDGTSKHNPDRRRLGERRCTFECSENGYKVTTSANYACTTSLSVDFRIPPSYIGKVKILCYLYASGASSNEIDSSFSHITSTGNANKRLVIGDIDHTISKDTINFDSNGFASFSHALKGCSTVIKIISFKCLIYDKLGWDLYPLAGGTSVQVFDDYRYGFDSRQISLQGMINYTNYGFFRRMLPYIKTNESNQSWIDPEPPEPIPDPQDYNMITGLIKVVQDNENIVQELLSSLNVSCLENKILSSCYIPIGGLAEFKNNIIETDCSLLSSIVLDPKQTEITDIKLNEYSCKKIKILSTAISLANNYNKFYYISGYPYQKSILISSRVNLNEFHSNEIQYTTTTNDKPFISYSFHQIKNGEIKDGEIKNGEIIENKNLIKLAECYATLYTLVNDIVRLPIQRGQDGANPKWKDPLYDAGSNIAFGYLHYSDMKGERANFPFLYETLSPSTPVFRCQPEEIWTYSEEYIYNLFGSTTQFYDITKCLTNNKNINSYTSHILFDALSLGRIRTIETLDLTDEQYNRLITYTEYNTLSGDAAAQQNRNSQIIKATKNMVDTFDKKIYYPSNYSGAKYAKTAIPPSTTLLTDNMNSYICTDYEKFISQFATIPMKTMGKSIQTTDIISGYLIRMRRYTDCLVKHINTILTSSVTIQEYEEKYVSMDNFANSPLGYLSGETNLDTHVKELTNFNLF